MPASPAILAIDAGGTFFKSALVLPSGEILAGSLRSAPVDSQGAAAGVIAAYAGVLKNALADAAAAGLRVAAVGVSTPGPFDYENCTSLMTHKFAAIRGVNLRDALGGAVPEIRGVPLRFFSDANVFMLGEQRRGAARGHANAVGVTLGTGVGFGCMAGGKILDNGRGGPFVVIFKLPCRDGILEDYVSARGIVRLFNEKLSEGAGSSYRVREFIPAFDGGIHPAAAGENGVAGGEINFAVKSGDESPHSKTNSAPSLDAAGIAALARQPETTVGSAAARAAFSEAGALLGETLRPVLRELAPTCLVAGGQISKSFDLFGGALRDALGGGERLLVTAAQNPGTAALLGAADAVSGDYMKLLEKRN
ncbi:MAG: ROK family protein [Opitutaceae bacterium]|jgi:glucokinase|nr:ROK family protein [Opitutaceae bacterium]